MDVTADTPPLVLSQAERMTEAERDAMRGAIAIANRLDGLYRTPRRRWHMERPTPSGWCGTTSLNGLHVEVAVSSDPEDPGTRLMVREDTEEARFGPGLFVAYHHIAANDLELVHFKRGPWEAQLMAPEN